MNSVDGSHMIRLTSLSGNATNPKWSPDGLKVAFSETMGRYSQLWVINRDGTDLRNLTAEEAFTELFSAGLQGKM